MLNAFSGSEVVAYLYKTKGPEVAANDRLRYCYHTARAIIENRNARLSDEEVEALLAPNADAGTFLVDQFHGYYYTKPVLNWLVQREC